MRNSLLAAVIMLLPVISLNAQETVNDRKESLKEHVYYLASDSLYGRKAGHNAKAREYIIREYESAGVQPFFESGWECTFERDNTQYCNVVGVIEGNDSILKNEYIVLGAHYDHLGVRDGVVYNGADDNASGTAALIEIARVLNANRDKLKRSVIIAAFDAEELGLYGSTELANVLCARLGEADIKLMMSIDMVGWYRRSGKLILEGSSTIKDGRKLLQAEADKIEINVKVKPFENSVFTATDTQEFARRHVPTIAVTTGLKSPYHKPGDDAELIDYDGMDKVSEYITDLTMNVASDPDFSGSGKVAAKHSFNNPMFEFGLYFSLVQGRIDFYKSSIETKSLTGIAGGAMLQFNQGNFGLRAAGFYEQTPCRYPAAADYLDSKASYTQNALTFPVTLLVQNSGGPARVYLGAGGYYTHVLDYYGSSDAVIPQVDDSQWGWHLMVGMYLGHISIELSRRIPIGGLFTADDAPAAKLNPLIISAGFVF